MPEWAKQAVPEGRLPILSSLGDALARGLPAYLPRQRWYGHKSQPLRRVELLDAAPLGGTGANGATYWLAITGLEFAGAAKAAYFLPVALTPAASGKAADEETICEIAPNGLRLRVAAALGDAAFQRACLQASRRGERLRGERGEFAFAASARHGERLAAVDRDDARARVSRAEQSNTSIIFADASGADRLLLKCFRRLMPGVNPELEITAFLSEQTSFTAIPLWAGSIEYRETGGDFFTLGVWQQYVANEGDGWAFLLAKLSKGGDAEPLLEEVEQLGQRTAQLHAALAGGTAPAFAPEPVTAEDLDGWASELRAWARRLAPELEAAAPQLGAELSATARRIARQLAGLPDQAGALAPLHGATKIRIHGDYHLGQVLRTPNADWVIFDFEGEPARPLAERRRKHCVLKDVAGMLRSLDYVAFAARAGGGARPERLEAWRQSARAALWRGYAGGLAAARLPVGVALLPAAPAARERALGFFELEKAIYELHYELHNRPDWLAIPLAGLTRLLAER